MFRNGDSNESYELQKAHNSQIFIMIKYLCDAIRQGRKDDIYRILSEGVNLNQTERNGFTPLSCAILKVDIILIDRLLDLGASPNAKNYSGGTPLYLAIIDDRPEIVEKLISFGADVNPDIYTDFTLLMTAVDEFQSPESAIMLLKNGADPRMKSKYGLTALDIALRSIPATWRSLEEINPVVTLLEKSQ